VQVKRTNKIAVGWREWVSLPQLGISDIKAKLDTGARSSALHAFGITIYRKRGVNTVRFGVHPLQRSTGGTVFAEAALCDRRLVRSSSGHTKFRPVILTELVLMGLTQEIELTLVNRGDMGFRMLLGRQALRGLFLVDANKSFVGGRPARTIRVSKQKEPS
jgi:hypothetical protein